MLLETYLSREEAYHQFDLTYYRLAKLNLTDLLAAGISTVKSEMNSTVYFNPADSSIDELSHLQSIFLEAHSRQRGYFCT